MIGRADPDIVEAIFDWIVETARAGGRCPTNPEISDRFPAIGDGAGVLPGLARDGRLIVRIYGRNWRDVEITTGPAKGLRTAPPPHGGQPYRVIERDGPPRGGVPLAVRRGRPW